MTKTDSTTSHPAHHFCRPLATASTAVVCVFRVASSSGILDVDIQPIKRHEFQKFLNRKKGQRQHSNARLSVKVLQVCAGKLDVVEQEGVIANQFNLAKQHRLGNGLGVKKVEYIMSESQLHGCPKSPFSSSRPCSAA